MKKHLAPTVFWSCVAVMAAFLASPMSGCLGPKSCNVKVITNCGSGETCNATSGKCEKTKACTYDTQDTCGNYACGESSCYGSCYNWLFGIGSDTYCNNGFKCDTSSYECVKAGSCNPATAAADCNNSACDPSSHSCKDVVRCSADAGCAGAYACENSVYSYSYQAFCPASCQGTYDCNTGFVCDADGGTCYTAVPCDSQGRCPAGFYCDSHNNCT